MQPVRARVECFKLDCITIEYNYHIPISRHSLIPVECIFLGRQPLSKFKREVML